MYFYCSVIVLWLTPSNDNRCSKGNNVLVVAVVVEVAVLSTV